MTTAGPSGQTVIAAFDFDGTVTTRDCVVPFLRRFLPRAPVLLGVLRNARSAASGIARNDRERMRSAATAAVLSGVPHSAVVTEADRFAREVIASWLRPDVLERIAWHRGQGHRVVLISASYEDYLIPVAEHIAAEAVLATRLEIGTDGRCTGRLDGRNCRAEEKVARLTRWLSDNDLRRDEIVLWAYGDSAGDRELLAEADRAVWATARLRPIL